MSEERQWLRSKLFLREFDFASHCDDGALWDALLEDVASGRAIAKPMNNNMLSKTRATVDEHSHSTFDVSVSYGESHQLKRSDLPIGARSLLFSFPSPCELRPRDRDSRTCPFPGAIKMRGVNKFDDIDTITDLQPISRLVAHHGFKLYLQRKMAGFIVHLFSADGVALEVMSKHATDSDHAALARAILERDANTKLLARELFDHKVVLSCECISVQRDPCHPVPEAEGGPYDESLVVFSATLRCSIVEFTWPFERLRSWCANVVGLQCVPASQVTSRGDESVVADALATLHREALQWYDDRIVRPAEGYVILLEVPCGFVAKPHANQHDAIQPVRLKLKALQYRVIRSLRSTLMGEHSLRREHEFFGNAFVVAVLHWTLFDKKHSPEAVRGLIQQEGVWKLIQEFKRDVNGLSGTQGPSPTALDESHVKKRPRDDDTIVDKYQVLTQWCEISAQRRLLHCNHAVMVLCGLPGSGKSTLARSIAALMASTAAAHRFTHVLHISRDAIAKTTARQNGISAESSQHQQRRLRKLVHDNYERCAIQACQWMCSTHADSCILVILDACHASVEARSTFSTIFPQTIQCVCVEVRCPDSLARLAQRVDHEILSAADAEGAYAQVQKVFVHPTSGEHFKDILVLDSSAMSLEAMTRVCLNSVGGGGGDAAEVQFVRSSPQLCTLVSDADVDALLSQELFATLAQVFGKERTRTDVSVDALYKEFEQSRVAHQRIVFASLDAGNGAMEVTWREMLWSVALDALTSVVQAECITGCAAPQGIWSSFWSRIRFPFLAKRAADIHEASAVVREGHSKWLLGKFLRRDTTTLASLTAEEVSLFRHRIQERFSAISPSGERLIPTSGDQAPHVTLSVERMVHSNPNGRSNAASADLGARERLLSRLERHFNVRQENNGQFTAVNVRLEEVLMDDKALCVAVSVASDLRPSVRVREQASALPGDRRMLHFTLGHTHHVAADYCGLMDEAFHRWEAQNNTASAGGARTKTINFIRIALGSSNKVTFTDGTVRIH